MSTFDVRQFAYDPWGRPASGRLDAVTIRATERLLEIIGEAANSLSMDRKSAYPNVDWRSIGRLRNLLAHHYFRTDPELIWTYATREVPQLAFAIS